ncbi:MAG: MiaB/RimO family radical SAM methylthiotransferase [Vicinamibacterales bacterium]
MRYAVVTFGCRVNQADSLEVEAALAIAGATAVAADAADLVVVNTCSVTASADQGARQTIRRIHRQNPSARIIVTGCFATRAVDAVAGLPGVAAVVPNSSKPGLGRALLALVAPGSQGPCGRPPSPGLMGRTAWTLRAQTGCEEACSYCIIPSTRGPSASRSAVEVLDELRRVVDAGYKEVVLTGVHLGAWGRDLGRPQALADLLGLVAGEPGRFRVRVSSLEPMDCTPSVLDVLCGSPERFAPHLHLPLQHSEDDLLVAMRRPYSGRDYLTLVQDVRRRLPDAAIGTDVIVGFPGESDRQAEALAEFLASSPVTHAHVFPYSDREGTDASAYGGKVHGAAVKARAARIRAVSGALTAKFRASQAGLVRQALTIDDGRTCVTDNYIRVSLPPGHARNAWVDVVVPPLAGAPSPDAD